MNLAATLSPLIPGAALRRLQGLPQPRLTGLLFSALAASTVVLFAILVSSGMSLSTEFAKFVLLAGSVAALAGFCHWRSHPWFLTESAAVVSLVTLSLLLCGLVSSVGVTLGLPLADGLLARGDALMGFDVGRVAEFVARHPALSDLLHFAYNSSPPLCAAAALWSLVRKDRLQMWQVVTTLVVAMQVTALVSILFPARGASVTLGLDALQGNGLPFGAGTYSATEFAQLYAGGFDVVTRDHVSAIVCFPSYHTVMALVIAQGFAKSPLKWPAILWGALTIVSTVPMGGHWVTDLGGGILVWVLANRLATWACRFPAPVAVARSAGYERFTGWIVGLRA